jgi:preprotein translocase subunit SecA
MVTRAIERAQKRVEEQNFSSRKHLLEYDDVMNQQRQVIYGLRDEILAGKNTVSEILDGTLHGLISDIFSSSTAEDGKVDFTQISKRIKSDLNFDVPVETLKTQTIDDLLKTILNAYQQKFAVIGDENLNRVQNFIYLQVIDRSWKNHLLAMDHLKDSVSLRGYGQRDPLQEYKREAFRLFETLMGRIHDETTKALIGMEAPRMQPQQQEIVEPKPATVFDQSKMTFQHPTQNAPTRNGPGSATAAAPQRPIEAPIAAPQPFRRTEAKVGRNDPCPCGSGKKYKKCHGADGDEAPVG